MSTKEDRKRERERFFLDEFLRHVPGLRFVEQGKPPEWPDFVLADDRGPLGLELTQLFRDDGPHGSPTVARERKRTECLRDLSSRYYARGGPPALVSAIYLDHQGRNLDDAVRLLLKAAGRPGNGPHAVKVPDRSKRWQRPWAEFHLSKLPREVGPYSDWRAAENSCALVGTLQPGHLRACIDEKAANLPSYRRHLDRVSLLIYVERNRGSGMIEPPDDRLQLDGAGFAAVYLLFFLRVGGPQVLRIDVGGQGLAPGPAGL